MAWTTPKTFAASDILTAAELNTHVRDNLREVCAATATTAGDIVYADAANSMGSRLAIGAADKVLVSNGSAPTWGDVPSHAADHSDGGSDPMPDGSLTGVMMAGDLMEDLSPYGYVEIATLDVFTTEATAATVNLVIPASWTTWRCHAHASFAYNTYTIGSLRAKIQIDGTTLQELALDAPATDIFLGGSLVAHRTGMTTDGTRSIVLRVYHGGGSGTGAMADISMYAQAYRVN